MTTLAKMLGRLFSRIAPFYYIILAVFLVLFFIYELKQLYLRSQKGRRFAFYNSYVNEVYHFADDLELSEKKTSEHVKHLSKIFKISLNKSNSTSGR